MPTGNTYLDGLAAQAGGYNTVLPPGALVQDFLLHAILQDVGIVVYEPGAALALNRIRLVNRALLDLLKYPDQATYAAAAVLDGFTHVDDLDVVNDHIQHYNSAVYDARFKRGDNGQYRKCRLQGVTYAAAGNGVLRVTIVRAAP